MNAIPFQILKKKKHIGDKFPTKPFLLLRRRLSSVRPGNILWNKRNPEGESKTIDTYRPVLGYKTDVLLIFSFITGDKTEFLSQMMFSNEYITGI